MSFYSTNTAISEERAQQEGGRSSRAISSSSVHDRLLQVKRSIRKVTLETLKQAADDVADTAAVVPSSSSFEEENNDPNSSFHLGMELFGQEVHVVEEVIQEKLVMIEQELENVVKMAALASDTAATTATVTMKKSPGFQKDKVTSVLDLEKEATALQKNVEFLRHCSLARDLVDQVATTLSSSTPGSISCSATSSGGGDHYVRAAQLVVQAQQCWSHARDVVVKKEQSSGGGDATTSASQLAAAYKILNALQQGIRKQKVDLLSLAQSMWKTSVSLQRQSLTVRSGQAIQQAYDVLETFDPTCKDNNRNSLLEDIIRKFTTLIQQQVFAPALDSHHHHAAAASNTSTWTLHESEERHLNLAGTTGMASSSLAAGGPVRVLEWSRDDDDNDSGNKITEMNKTTTTTTTSAAAAWRNTFAFLERILVFIADHVLLSRPRLCEMVGRRFLGAPSALPTALRLEALGLESCRIGNDNGLLMQPLVESLAKTCIPTFLKPDQLDQLHTTKKELESIINHFLDRMMEKGLLSSGKTKTTRLTHFVSNFEHKYVQNRRCVRLNQARALLIDNDYHNTVPVGVEIHQCPDEHLGLHDGMDIFRLHRCNISDTANKIMQMCRECMDEAVEEASANTSDSSSPLAVLPAILYRTAREVLDLFRAIIPVAHGNEIAHVPRTAAVLHNDCVYFAHHSQILGVEYKEKFAATTPAATGKQQDEDGRGTVLRQTCIFVDMVPLFRELADRSMRKMLDLQASQLVELVGQRITLLGQALREDEIVAEWSEAEAALTTGLHHLKHLANVWKPILSQDVCRRSLCYLADVMFTLLLDQVTNKATDISESACPFVSTMFQRASCGVSEILGIQLDNNQNNKTTRNSVSACRVWDRFIAVGRFMNMNLNDVQIALGDGLFRSVSGPELARLIVATFAESPKRQKVLVLLASTN